MAPIAVDGDAPAAVATEEFAVTHYEVDLDVDFAKRTITAEASLTVQPLVKSLKYIPLNCRQIKITSVSVDGRAAQVAYDDPYDRLTARPEYGIQQFHQIQESLESTFRYSPEGELLVTLPKDVKIKGRNTHDPHSSRAQENGTTAILNGPGPKLTDEIIPAYKSILVKIQYVVTQYRDALHWVGLDEDDQRYPQVYTRHQNLPNDTSCFIFPCVDCLSSRSTWRVTLRCPRTLGDVFHEITALEPQAINGELSSHNDAAAQPNGIATVARQDLGSHLTDEEKALEIVVICSGYMEDSDAPGEMDLTKRRWVFGCNTPVAPHHVGFAIGPFEQIDLSGYRESDQDERLGDHAVRLHAFCLPGRTDEVLNSCQPLAMALDYFTITYGSYPFEAEATSHKMIFVDDLPTNVVDAATMSICSSRLLLPPDVQDGMVESLREMVHALSSQWLGVNVVPKAPGDFWIIVGGSYFMADSFMQTLYGRNEYRYRQKITADKVFEMDVRRPSIKNLGDHVSLDQSNLEFLALKAPLVLFIMDQRIVKGSGRNGLNRILWRIFLDIKVGKAPTNEISTLQFMRSCEKVGHIKLDSFFQQWVFGAGCPTFHVSQRFNKKKLVVEMIITQQQSDADAKAKLDPEVFMRDVKEHEGDVWAGELQSVFTGPMTIRIHEADGTPYEHIVDIRDKTTKVEIPYNTKYKRLKRSKRQKERQANAVGVDVSGDPTDDVLLYCLGDVLQTNEDMASWRLEEWSKEEEERMEQEFFEWIRIDKDFEWICRIQFGQPHYMYVSQLQQDNDVVAQVESVRYLQAQKPHRMISTILVRTLMDQRYFHGIRTMAADALINCATEEADCEWVGLFHLRKAFQEMFCLPDSPMTRSNDFSDRASYMLQCAIPQAMAKIRDTNGRVPDIVKDFFLDKLKFNDNTNNEFSDAQYVSILMSCLAKSLTVEKKTGDFVFDMGDDEQEDKDAQLKRIAMAEIDRHRRIDEWIPSFQNVFTVTAMDCLSLLIRERLEPRRLTEFLQYSRPGNSAQVRLKAFDCLVDLGAARTPAVLRYMIQSYYTEPSPFVRVGLWHSIGRGFGLIATTIPNAEKRSETNGLVIEGEGLESRQQDIARTETMEGAQMSLKTQLKDNVILQGALLDALRSPMLGHRDYLDVLTLCRLLYEPVNSLVFQRKLPTYWRVEHRGDGKLRFSKADSYRTKPMPKLDMKQLKRSRNDSEDTEAHALEAKRRRASDKPNVKEVKRMQKVSEGALAQVLDSMHQPQSGKLDTKEVKRSRGDSPDIMITQAPDAKKQRLSEKVEPKDIKRVRDRSENASTPTTEAKSRGFSDTTEVKEVKRVREATEGALTQTPGAKPRRTSGSSVTGRNRDSVVSGTANILSPPSHEGTPLHLALEPVAPTTPAPPQPLLKKKKKSTTLTTPEPSKPAKGSLIVKLRFLTMDVLKQFPYDVPSSPSDRPLSQASIVKPPLPSRKPSTSLNHPTPSGPPAGIPSSKPEKKIKLKLNFKK